MSTVACTGRVMTTGSSVGASATGACVSTGESDASSASGASDLAWRERRLPLRDRDEPEPDAVEPACAVSASGWAATSEADAAGASARGGLGLGLRRLGLLCRDDVHRARVGRDGGRRDLGQRVLGVIGDAVRARSADTLSRLRTATVALCRAVRAVPVAVAIGAVVATAVAVATTTGAATLLLRRSAQRRRTRLPAVLDDGIVMHDDSATRADLAGLAERFEEPETELLARHLHQAERGDLGDLVLRAVAAETFDHAAQHEVAIGLEHHVDEVDDDDAADVSQAQLAHDLLGGLEVVLRDRLLEVSARADELARVHVDDGHRLCAVDHEDPPEGSQTLRSSAFSICSETRNSSNASRSPS